MTTFDDRERAFENLYAHDQDLAFRAGARRNREIGLWAARQLGLTGTEAEAYATAVLVTAIEKGGNEAVVAKIEADLAGRGLTITDHQVRRRMGELLAESIEAVKHG